MITDRHLEIVLEGGLLLLAIGAPLSIGAVHQPVVAACCLLSCLLFILLLLRRRRYSPGVEIPWFGVALLVATGYTILQVIPLPPGLLRAVAPASMQKLEVAFSQGGTVHDWHPISLDPPATVIEVVKLGTCTLAFITAHNFLHRADRAMRLLYGLVIAASVVVFLGLIGAVIAPGKLLLLYEPQYGPATGLIATSFVNPNHGAAFLTICAVLAYGFVLHARAREKQLLWVVATVFLAVGACLTLSRGGIAAMIMSFLLLTVLSVFTPQQKRRSRSRLAIVAAVWLLLLAVPFWLAPKDLVAEFQDVAPLAKIDMWPSGVDMIADNPWVGVGRGAFMSTFPQYIRAGINPGGKIYTHIENQFLQLPAEWGILGCAIIIASVVALVQWLSRCRRDSITMAIAAAIAAIGLHNLVDFNLETLGIACLVSVLAGTLSAHKEPEKARDVNRRLNAAALVGTIFVVIVSIGLSLRTLLLEGHMLSDDLQRIRALATRGAPVSEVNIAVDNSIRAHPASYQLPLIKGKLLILRDPKEALEHLNRAQFLFPHSTQVHLEKARALAKLGHRERALEQYGDAFRTGTDSPAAVAGALSLCRSREDILSVLSERAVIYQLAVVQLIRNDRAEDAAWLSAQARSSWPNEMSVYWVAVDAHVAAGKWQAAVDIAREANRMFSTPYSYRVFAKASGYLDLAAAEAILREASKKYPDDVAIIMDLAFAYFSNGDYEGAIDTASRVLRISQEPSRMVTAYRVLAGSYRAQGRQHMAKWAELREQKLREMR